jgi:uncharacterized Zn-finger protein
METSQTTHPLKTLKGEEKIITTSVAICDGGKTDGHPRVYLDLSKTGKAPCPYCSQIFTLKSVKEN